MAVGQYAADEYADDEREGTREADEADLEGRSGEVVDLYGHGDARHQGADEGAEESGIEEAEIAVLAERREVHGEAGQTGHERLQGG